MALFNFFKPKWQHRDKAVRLAAVRDMSNREIETLARIAGSDDDQAVRLEAVAKIEDVDVLASLAATAIDEIFKQAVLARRNARLAEVVLTAQEDIVRNEAFSRIDDAQTLAGIVLVAEAARIRLQAVQLIDDETILAGILEKPCGKEVSLAALAKINDLGLLKRLTDSAKNRSARRFAAEKLAKLERQVNPVGDIAKELEALAKEAITLAESRQWEQAASRFVEIEAAWRRFDPNGVHPRKAAVDEALRQFTERRLQAEEKRALELRRADEFSQETAKREALCQLVESLIGSLAADSDTRFEHALASWPEVGHFSALSLRFSAACEKYRETRVAIIAEKKLFAGFSEEVSRLERLVASDEWRQVSGLLDGLLVKLGDKKFQYVAKLELKDRLAVVRKRFIERQQASKEDAARQVEDAIAKRQELCAELESLVDLADRQEAEKRFRDVEAAWSGLKPLADAELDGFWANQFKEVMGRFQARQQEYYHRQDWQLWANRNLKEELCQQVEALDSEENLALVAEKIKAAQAEWKKIGPLPRKEAAILWQCFHEATERNFARCAPYFAEQEQLRNGVLNRKEEICLEAEKFVDSTDWKETAKRLKELQTEWKGLASVQRHKEEKLYKRLRQACNHFFSRASLHYGERDQELRQNLAAKIKLCEELEAIAAAPKADLAGRIRELRAAWKAVGPVPRDEVDAVWQRFTAGLDGFKDFLDSGRQENLQRKEALCALVEKQVAAITEATDLRALAEKFVAIKQEWRQIGPVPDAKSEAIWQRFNKPLNEFFAMSRERLQQINAISRANLRQKEEILGQAERLAALEVWDEAAIEAMRGLERQWQDIGPAPKDKEVLLREDFKNISNAFLSGQREYFVKRREEQFNNQRHKEMLCLKLENILGLQPSESGGPGQNKILTLAEEMKLALEFNFTYAGLRAGQERMTEEIKRLQDEWRRIGLASPEQEQFLATRFRRAVDMSREREKE